MSIHPATGWLRIDVEREGESLGDEFGVVGYSANHTPVTSFTMLGPKERTVYVELLDGDVVVSYVRVAKPSLSDRQLARTAIHVLRIWYGERETSCAPNTECGCEFPLGTAWRWFEACEVEALYYAPHHQDHDED